MLVSIVIPAINEVDVIESSISKAWAAGADEVIVSDGGSTDGTIEICDQADCILVVGPAGRGTQLNSGVAKASGDVLVFLHADNWLAENSIRQIQKLNESKSQPALFGCFKQNINDIRRVFRWIEKGNSLRAKWRGLVYGDQAMFVSRSLFLDVGGFPDYPLMEDLAISQILKKHARPALLNGPIHVDARRWIQNGPVRQTLKNWYLSTAFLLGAKPESLAKKYRRHDKLPTQ